MIAGVSVAAELSVFVSSTCKDLDGYRRAVEDAIRTKAQMACVLSEDWTGGFDDTVQKCKDRVLTAFAFMLLLGYYYGWSPLGDKSITHMEFEWALSRWQQTPYPPMAVFAPRQNSDADKDLRAQAEKFIPQDPTERAKHAARLEQFRNEVLNAGRTAQFYADRHELREYSIVACLLWKGLTPMAAAHGAAPSAGASISDDQLGQLGRKSQMDVLDDILAQFHAEPDQPAAAILVYGDEDAGQRVFLRHLSTSKHLSICRPSLPGHPPIDAFDMPVLTQWVARSLGLTAAAEAQDPTQLADAVAAELRGQPLYFMLDRLQRLSGDLGAFVTDFWRPLQARLLQIHAQNPLPNRLLAFVADYNGDLTGRKAFVCDAERVPLDFRAAIALPKLGCFKPKDVLLWLDAMKVPTARRAEIASSVVKNAAGDAEGKPLRVYERLRSLDLFEEQNV